MLDTEKYFNRSYVQSRNEFRDHLSTIKEKWPEAELYPQSIGKEEDNTIDVIYSEATSSNEQILFFTTGEHGIEGYAGAAVAHLFIEEYLDQVDSQSTGICFVHAINPWGMKNLRRVTENNVDLNRNYFFEPDTVPENVNQHYAKESEIFQPNGMVKDIAKEKTALYEQLSKGMMNEGHSGIKLAKGMGQFQFERGVYYGGSDEEESTKHLKKWQRKLLTTYPRVIHMDWHTALGPTNEITMVMSEHDEREEEELKVQYGMKNIKKFTPKNVKGDSTNYFHKLKKEVSPDTKLFSALFEFGTFGADKKAELRELTTIILENQQYWEGAVNEEDRQWILDEFYNMFYPDEEVWRESVLKEARLAIDSVLKEEGILLPA